MTERIWDRFLTERDKAVFAAAGFGTRAGFGKRPALLVIDVTYGFCGDRPEPLLESIARWPASCGEDAWNTIPTIGRVINAARARGLPVIYTTGIRRADNWDGGSWRWKVAPENRAAPRRNAEAALHDQIVEPLAPGPRDIVVTKRKPSAFFGTDLTAFLNLLGCDSVIVTGATTSGCVRATVLDAFSLNYRTCVVEDGCFDRGEASHAMNLCEMHAKYADVVASAEVIAFIESLEEGLFVLPEGA